MEKPTHNSNVLDHVYTIGRYIVHSLGQAKAFFTEESLEMPSWSRPAEQSTSTTDDQL